MKIIEFFCGTKSFSKVAEQKGHKVYTIDYNPKFKPNLCVDMLYFNIKMLPKDWRHPDMIWCSPPCETFSLCGHNWYMGFPTNPKTYIGMALAFKCIELIRELKPSYWVIENPRGGLRSVWFMKPLERTTACYCQYGFDRMKPTDLWNNFGFVGKECKPNGDCHTAAPRGSKNGTQGEKSSEERGIIPSKLCMDILDKIEEVQNATPC